MTGSALIRVAVVTAAHGIRGEVKLRIFYDNPDDIFAGPLTSKDGNKKYTLHLRGHKDDLLIVAIDGVTTRNDAELLKGTEFFIGRDQLSDQRLPEEIIGLKAVLADGSTYGMVVQLMNYGAGDLIEIALPNDTTELLPLDSAFVGEINKNKGTIVVNPPEYLEAKGEEQ